MLGPLTGNRDFARLWTAQAVSAVGSRITRTVLPILAILTIDATPAQISLLAALGYAPGLIVSLFAGGLVDRRAKRPLLVGADLVRAGLLLTVPLAAHLHLLTMGQLYLVAGLTGAATTLFGIADNAYLPALVPADRIVAANARLEVSDSVAEGVGPGLGGLLVAVIGAPLALVVDAASYLWSAFFLWRIDRAGQPVASEQGEDTGLFRDALAGLRTCRAHPLVAALLTAQGVMTLSGGFFFALYMVVTVDLLALSPLATGLIIGLGGLGAALGAVLSARVERRWGRARSLVGALLIGKLWDLAVPLSLVWPPVAVPLLAGAQIFGDCALTIFGILALSLRQTALPLSHQGRANATFHLVEGAALVTGALLAGALATVMPVSTVIWGATVGGFLAVALLIRPARSAA